MTKKITTIVLTDEMQNAREEIIKSLDGGKLSHQAIYNRGLINYKNSIIKKTLKINEENIDK